MFDSNNDGRISSEEFLKLIKKIGGIMTGGQAKALLTLVDMKMMVFLSIYLVLFRLTRMIVGTLNSGSFNLSGKWSLEN